MSALCSVQPNRIMKYLQVICVLSVIALAHGGDNEEKFKDFLEECRKQTNASIDDVKSLDEDIPKTRTQLCLTACYYKKTGVLDKENNINVDKAIEDFGDLKKNDKDQYKKLVLVLRECNAKYIPVKDACDSIQIFSECMAKST